MDMTKTSPFRYFKTSPEIIRTPAQNVVKARRWLAMIVEDRTFGEIAKAEGTSKRRIQDVVELALRSPEALDAIASGVLTLKGSPPTI